ncbi:MAG: hypothetical protein EON60_09460 [Alphaproteobacteria bacterium]|nr:MAG: hypothetical protein EON60_09460 [Alphaproteobacteria bacterium]
MRTTPTRSTSAALILALALLASLGHAQPQAAQASRAARLEWPRTFTGQPDFLFTRDEARAEARTRAARENEPMPMSPSLQQLLEDDTTLDPLGLTTPQRQEIVTDASGTVVSGTDTITVSPRGLSLMERLMAETLDLPAVSSTVAPDLTEFTNQLNAAINGAAAAWQPSPGGYNFESVLNNLVLQAIVTSPVRYAVINQQRYAEGEVFRINVPITVPDAVLQSAMSRLMPAPGALPAALEESYAATYKKTWDDFVFKRNQNPELGRQSLVLPVRITGITARQVLLDVNGQPYALQIRYAY